MPTSHTVDRSVDLLAFLLARYPGMSKTTARQWLKHHAVQVNGQSLTRPDHVLQAGDLVTIHTKGEATVVGHLAAGVRLLLEDNDLIVIEKPASLLSIANQTQRDKTAYAIVTDYVRGKSTRSALRVWVVHRLDRETSGLMVFAKTAAAKRTMQADWSQAETEKRYLAVVEGSPPAAEGVLSSYLDESQPFRVFDAPPSERTRHAVTRYRVLRRRGLRTLVELTLDTGRRHQIRVQLATAQCPVVGDLTYGAVTNPARRVALHACFLQFRHPSSRKLLQFESPLPPELAWLVPPRE